MLATGANGITPLVEWFYIISIVVLLVGLVVGVVRAAARFGRAEALQQKSFDEVQEMRKDLHTYALVQADHEIRIKVLERTP